MSEHLQKSFKGGMDMLSDSTRIDSNEYVFGLNLRNRNDVLEPVLESQEDPAAPAGLKQGILTFGNFVIMFVAGKAYYRYYSATGWVKIPGFSMSPTSPRYWTEVVPLATTLYARLATEISSATAVDPNDPIITSNSIITVNGNTPGLLVQDNVQQPQFIFINGLGFPEARVTQTYAQWALTINTTTLVVTVDAREYVPIGNIMSFVDGVLYIVSQDGNQILRSVSGRPLDFVINIGFDGQPGGDAFTTSYSVGAGTVTCLRGMSDGSLFVAAVAARTSRHYHSLLSISLPLL